MWQSIVLIISLLWTGVAHAQVTNMPKHVQDRLAEVGPVWGQDIFGNIAKTLEVYTPILRDVPKTGIRITHDLSYRTDDRHKLDLYQPQEKGGVPTA